jgi:inorganic pyrophosphatase
MVTEDLRMAIDWEHWNTELRTRGMVIDRAQGTPHPRFPAAIYPVDYGYLPGTVGGEGAPVDIFIGSQPERELVAVVATQDALKGDAELKLLWGTTEAEIGAVLAFLNRGAMTARLIRRPIDRQGNKKGRPS